MKRSLLPLTALRAFEAAGRHESFKQAAEELSVSEAAISRQVRDLEKRVHSSLFHRDHRSVHLTDRGRDLLTGLTRGFDAIDHAIVAAAGRVQEVVSLSVEPTFANLFLIPHLGQFSKSHPDVEVRFEANSALVDLRDPDGPTLAIRYSLERASWPNVEARHLMDDWLTPMLSPGLAATIKKPKDLLRLKLLKDETTNAWMRWFKAAGVIGAPDWGPTFSNAASAIQGAEFGQGAVLGNRQVCGRLLSTGRVVAPFDLAIPNGAYWMVSREFQGVGAAEKAFLEWLSRRVRDGAAVRGMKTDRAMPRRRAAS